MRQRSCSPLLRACHCRRRLTFSDIINAFDTRHTPVAYLPMGSGNALRHALKYKRTLAKIARQIKSGQFHDYDLINCANKARGFLVSIGIEGTVIRLLNKDTSIKHKSFGRYLQKVWKAYAGEYKRLSATVTCDGKTFQLKNLLSLMVMKQPYYGYGLKLVPQARFDDRRLHILWNTSGLLNFILTIICSFTIGNRIGHYHTCGQATVNLNAPHFIQIDGNQGWRADEFTFRVLPRALRIKF